MEKTIITQYSDSELSLLFNNEEGLYNDYMRAVRRNDFSIVKELCDELYEYTEEQLDELENSFNAEVLEYSAE